MFFAAVAAIAVYLLAWGLIPYSGIRLAQYRKLTAFFAWYDVWVGVFWDAKKHALYVCPVPMFVIKVDFRAF